MPFYKHSVFTKSDSAAFDQTYPPGARTPYSGIYRCEVCGFEVVSTEGHPLPPEHSCVQHSAQWQCRHGIVRWRLVTAPVHVNNN